MEFFGAQVYTTIFRFFFGALRQQSVLFQDERCYCMVFSRIAHFSFFFFG